MRAPMPGAAKHAQLARNACSQPTAELKTQCLQAAHLQRTKSSPMRVAPANTMASWPAPLTSTGAGLLPPPLALPLLLQ